VENKANNISSRHITFVALAVVINIVGGQIALVLKLPIYLDSIGTMMVASILGPVYGMIPSLLSGIIMGITTDIYSLYFAPCGILLGLVTGLVYKKYHPKKLWIILAALVITIPSAIASACIAAYLFGGFTSSGSSIIVQLLRNTQLGLVLSCFIVQVCTDYLDRVIGLYLCALITKVLPPSLLDKFRNQ